MGIRAGCVPPPYKAMPQASAPASLDAGDVAAVEFGHLVRPGVCKRCKEERRIKERDEAKAKKEIRSEARAQALEEGLATPERVELSLGERPFGMTPSKAEGVGYLVAKVSAGKP